MSIFKGDSIYKSGGGSGGGYKDGGALVDGDFIDVENNTISTYENSNRNEINFVLPYSDVLNAVIELDNNSNATVNVYTVNNGFYVPIGNIGGNTVTAGNSYTVNITGNSFVIEQVSGGGSDPEFATIEGSVYGVKKVNDLFWTTEDFKSVEYEHVIKNGVYYYPQSVNINIDGWRIPTKAEKDYLATQYTAQQLKSTSDWEAGYTGNNESGLNFKAFGNVNQYSGNVQNNGYESDFLIYDQDINATVSAGLYYSASGYNSISTGGVNNNKYCVRLVKHI